MSVETNSSPQAMPVTARKVNVQMNNVQLLRLSRGEPRSQSLLSLDDNHLALLAHLVNQRFVDMGDDTATRDGCLRMGNHEGN